jgi:uncharacterized protein (DUF1697 family)
MKSGQYVAFLRAINVGGRWVKMTALKNVFEKAGFSDVATFIGSGNVFFTSRVSDAAKLEKSIERSLQAALGFPVVTFVRTPAEVAAIARRDPFGKPVPPCGRLFVGLVHDKLPAAVCRQVVALRTATDIFCVRGREVYWLCRVPSMQSLRLIATLEKTLGVPATLRNVNTFRRLAEKYPA